MKTNIGVVITKKGVYQSGKTIFYILYCFFMPCFVKRSIFGYYYYTLSLCLQSIFKPWCYIISVWDLRLYCIWQNFSSDLTLKYLFQYPEIFLKINISNFGIPAQKVILFLKPDAEFHHGIDSAHLHFIVNDGCFYFVRFFITEKISSYILSDCKKKYYILNKVQYAKSGNLPQFILTTLPKNKIQWVT